MKRFDGKVVVITGGNSGIGLAAAQQFEAERASVVVTGRDEITLEAAAKSLGNQALTVKAEVTKTSDLDNLFATVREKYGRIDVLFVNAGGAKVASVADTTEELFDEISDTNFRGAYFTAQKAIPLFSDQGAVIFTTSYFDEVGMAGTSVLSAPKAAVRSLTRTLASELLPRRIRVNAISPGVITTPIFGRLGVPKEVVEIEIPVFQMGHNEARRDAERRKNTTSGGTLEDLGCLGESGCGEFQERRGAQSSRPGLGKLPCGQNGGGKIRADVSRRRCGAAAISSLKRPCTALESTVSDSQPISSGSSLATEKCFSHT